MLFFASFFAFWFWLFHAGMNICNKEQQKRDLNKPENSGEIKMRKKEIKTVTEEKKKGTEY